MALLKFVICIFLILSACYIEKDKIGRAHNTHGVTKTRGYFKISFEKYEAKMLITWHSSESNI